MAKIHVLDREVSELIAAGEVVERPSSVVKELVENAIDAGASEITVEIRNGGISYIRVSDNGSGIARDDLPNAFLRHATSKIVCKEDLFSIGTMGFRGEALAAISAVSKIEVQTRTNEETAGTKLTLSGAEGMEISDIGCPRGTTMIVTDLFYNTPARLKFMKKDAAEAAQISSLLDMLALSNPHVSLTLIRDGRRALSTPGDGQLKNAIFSVMGKNIASNMIPVRYEYDQIKVRGYIGKPVLARPNRKMEIMFLNGRYVRSGIYTAALETGYKNSITIGKYPVAVLHIEISPSLVDINVHPAKMEAKFSSERTFFDAVFFAVKSALSDYAAREQMAFPNEKGELGDTEKTAAPLGGKDQRSIPSSVMGVSGEGRTKNSEGKIASGLETVRKRDDAHRANDLINAFIKEDMEKKRADFTKSAANEAVSAMSTNVKAGEEILSVAQSRMVPYQTKYALEKGAGDKRSASFGQPEISRPKEENEGAEQAESPNLYAAAEFKEETEKEGEMKNTALSFDGYKEENEMRVVGEVFATYIILESKDQMLLIDKHAVHERLIYEKIRKTDGDSASQILLEPVVVDLTKDEFTLVQENRELLLKAGFLPEEFGVSSVVLREVPVLLDHKDVSGAFIQTLDAISQYKSETDINILDRIYYSMACRAAVKAGDAVSEEEIKALAKQWLEHGDIKFCPHGRPVCISLDQKYLEKQFKRIQ